LGEYQNPVKFDFAVATEFAAKLREAAGKITTFEGERGRAESMAAAEFQGFFSRVTIPIRGLVMPGAVPSGSLTLTGSALLCGMTAMATL
jgi:hypothetical protein